MVLTGIALVFLLNRGGEAPPIIERAPTPRHPVAVDHIPGFIASPGSPDILLGITAAVLIGAVLATGVLFFWLHSLPERLVHKSTKVHFDIVAVLALLSLFTHMHIFWVAALLLALVKVPNFSFLTRHLQRITVSLERIADAQPKEGETSSTGPSSAASHNERKPC
jgi:multisubunit Na+/H+ antiporter MnhF subunit